MGWQILFFAGVGGLFVALSIPLVRRRIGPNSFYGLRVPDTLESERVWFEANARFGVDLLRCGVRFTLTASVLGLLSWQEPEHYAMTCCGLLLMLTLALVVRGFRVAASVKQELSAVTR
jgi:hypothetical protein